jgi:uncharacterized protein (TIGR00725 family)
LNKSSHQKFKIAVLGSAAAQEDSAEYLKAHRVGRAVAENGGIILTGACPGLPQAAVKGATEAGGLSLGISPAANLAEHVDSYGYPTDSTALIFTGMGKKGRNVILVRSADACIFVGGGMGTLNEFTIAFDELGEQNVIGILTGTGGFSDELLNIAGASGRSSKACIIADFDAEKLVKDIFDKLKRLRDLG